MLEELRIQNFAIIDRLELSFAPGLNVITGETGAGKSIIVDAVELLLGAKADATMIRSGAERATVEGIFALRGIARGMLLPVLEREDLLADGDDIVTLYREVRANGRSLARVNGVSVNQEVLREVGDTLVDIHGQSEHLSLLNPRNHLDLLDRYADLMGMRDALQTLVDVLHKIRAEIRTLEDDKDALERRAEMLRHEIEDIESANLDPAEEGDLRAERTKLSNSEQLATLAASIITLLSGDAAEDLPGVDRMQQVAAALGKLAAIDADLQDWAEVAEGIAAQVQDLAVEMADYADAVEYNPQRLNDIEERLEVINKLKRRYNADSVAALLARATAAREALAGIENSDERLEDLRKQERDKLTHIGDLSNKISGVRKTVGKQLSKRVMRELADLRMERAQFEIGIEQHEDSDGCIVGERRLAFDATGIDKVEMLLSANPGEALRPLAKVASGGEAARIMLALKRVLTAADHTPTLIFDEVDQGIGGRIGTVVGEKLWTLTHGHQVMVVTHLPQLAGFADRHYHVKKIAQADRTSTHVTALDNDADRIGELAAMLGTIGESGMASARDILAEAHARKVAAQGAAAEG
ncbi:MAG: DNA repair protein RecN [Chloroflexi bacterium]|nr:DNA repair protein RecN [Chloroflexota bacterium]